MAPHVHRTIRFGGVDMSTGKETGQHKTRIAKQQLNVLAFGHLVQRFHVPRFGEIGTHRDNVQLGVFARHLCGGLGQQFVGHCQYNDIDRLAAKFFDNGFANAGGTTGDHSPISVVFCLEILGSKATDSAVQRGKKQGDETKCADQSIDYTDESIPQKVRGDGGQNGQHVHLRVGQVGCFIDLFNFFMG
tara:strand:- start:14 stop:580 length:567 start_codon:yes stop_codon:yes gene_type:complete